MLNKNLENCPSDFGREYEPELNQNVSDSDLFTDSDFDKDKINRKILDLSTINPNRLTDVIFINSNLNTHDFEIKKISDGMLWHMRLIHASINYHKQIQKNQNELKLYLQEIISLDKAKRDIIGKTFYPITIWCDNTSAGKNTEMEGSRKLKDFDYPVEVLKRKS